MSSTTTKASSTTTKASSTKASGSSTTTSMPSLTTTKSSSTSKMPKITATSSTSSIVTPTITPPAASDNPYIWKSSAPSGSVFIAVGAVAGFIFLSVLVFLLITKIFARKAAKKSLALSDSSSSSFSNSGSVEKLENTFYQQSASGSTIQFSHLNKSQSQNKIPLLYENSRIADSTDNISDTFTRPQENIFSTLDANDNNKRKSMFLSPTAEVMNFNRKQQHQRMVGSVSNLQTPDGSYYGRQSPHERSESYDNNTEYSIQSPERGGGVRSSNRAQRTVPSAYLESMFED